MKTYRPTGEVRHPKKGELCSMGNGDGVTRCPSDNWGGSPRMIYEEVDDTPCPDSIMESIVALHRSRSVKGLAKYGVTLDRNDLTIDQWLEHLLTELVDACGYTQRLRRQFAASAPTPEQQFVNAASQIGDEVHRLYAERFGPVPLAARRGWVSIADLDKWDGAPLTIHSVPRMVGGKPIDFCVLVTPFKEPVPCPSDPPSTSPA